MSMLDDLELVRRALDVPGPGANVAAAGRDRLDALVAGEAPVLATPTAGKRRHLRTEPGRGRRPWARAALACGVGAAAAIATTLVVANPHARTSDTGKSGTPSPTGQPVSTGSVQQAILTAAGSVSGDIMETRVTTSGGPDGAGDGVIQYLSWPARPTPGQQVHLLILRGSLRTEETYTEPTQSGSRVMTTGTALLIDTGAKTWSRDPTRLTPNPPEQISLFLLDKNTIRKDRVMSTHATLDGRPAIELSEPGAGYLRILLWADGQTYLPLRLVKLHWSDNPASRMQYDFQFLPPTPANRALLTPVIPPGYRQVPPS